MPKPSPFNVIVTSLTIAATVSLPVFPSERRIRGPVASDTFYRSSVVLLQDFAHSAGFQGQDIMGGAEIIFKRPARMRDLAGGAALMVVKRQPRPSRPVEIARNTSQSRPAEIARNNSSDRRRPPSSSAVPEAAGTTVSDDDKGEAFKNQGNTYYDLGKFAEAIEAYQNALKYTPKDAVIYNNLGAAYFSLNRNSEAADAFKKSLALISNDSDAYFNLGFAYSSTN
jgi:tetratricopeptide (TPR) repeat protein